METDDRFDIAVIGAGSAATSFITAMEGSGQTIVVFEPDLVGGECPFRACIPSKSMLHDSLTGRSWRDAVARRDDLVDHLDDSSHVEPLVDAGATVVRERARLDGPGRVVAGHTRYEVDHVVVANGAVTVMPDIDGLDADHDRVWTHRDVLTSSEQPDSVVVLGGGVIGSELALMYAGFGTDATTIDEVDRPVDDLHPRVGEIMADVLTDAGVELVNGAAVVRVEANDDAVTVHTDDDRTFRADRLLVAVGRRPDLDDLGLESVGLDPADVDVDDTGRVTGAADGASIWMAGDAAGRKQYTHLANHHGTVLADQLAGDGERRYGDVVVPACIFIDPPVFVIGDSYVDADERLVWATAELETARHSTDERRAGFMAVAVDPETRCIAHAHGIGPGVDELTHALVIAIDGAVPIETLRRTIQPFPTLGGALAGVYDAVVDALDDQSRS